MRKRDIVYTISLLLLLIATIASSLYAWFSLVEKTQPIIIYSGTIELDAKLYKKEDPLGNEINNIEHSNVVPGDTFLYELIVTNNGSLDGELSLLFNLNEESKYLKDFLIINVRDSNNNLLFTYEFSNQEQSYKYALALESEETQSIYIEIIIKETLELSDITNANYFKIDTLEIRLIQDIA